MKTVLKHIFEKKREYQRLPLFERMRDEGIDALDRLGRTEKNFCQNLYH